MDFVVRLVRTARDLVFGSGSDPVVLRHRHTGALLTSAPEAAPVQFSSASEARAFSRRFLDEARAWQAVAPAEANRRAA